MNSNKIIRRPLVTEKSTMQRESGSNVIAFEVAPEANKIQVVVPDDKFLETVRSKGFEKPWLEAANKIGVDGPALLKAFQQDIARSESSSR